MDSNTNIQIMSPGVFGIDMRGCMLRSNWLGHLDWGTIMGPKTMLRGWRGWEGEDPSSRQLRYCLIEGV